MFDNEQSLRCKNTIIGGQFVRGISGGERKRVSIGHEILINPSLLLLDEPTSGLDSSTALKIVQLLHKISKVRLKDIFLLQLGIQKSGTNFVPQNFLV